MQQQQQQQQKTMFKVVSPIKKKNGEGDYWMRCGTAFTNKDNSINVYLDAVPTQPQFTLQLRELTEEDFARSAERRARFDLPRTASGVSHLDQPPPAMSAARDSVPF